MVKTTLSLVLLLLTVFPAAAMEIIYEQYGKQVDLWIIIPYNSLNFKKGSDQADYTVSGEISNTRKKPVASFNQSISVPKRAWLQDTGIPVKLSKELSPGSYNLQIQLKNKSMGDKRDYKRHFELSEYGTEIGMGWILAKREGFQFIPDKIAASDLDELSLLQSFSLQPDSLKIKIDKQSLSINKPSSPISLNISDYLKDDAEHQVIISLYEKNILYRMEPFLFSPWYSYSLRYSLEEQMQQIRYIATQNEWQVLSKLPKNKYAEAIEGFWKVNDPSPETVRNETREKFYQRVLTADELFTIHKKMKGWSSDRGRIYIKFGEPDDIYSETYPVDKYPHIIWYYYKQNLQFVFADTKGYGQYTLRNKDEEY